MAAFVEPSTYRVYDIVKDGPGGRNRVHPGGYPSGLAMTWQEAEAAGWKEASEAARGFDRVDGLESKLTP